MLSEALEFYKTVSGPILGPLLLFLRNWWWVFLPLFLYKPFSYLWLWWRNEDFLAKKYRPVLFEIKIPKENVKPIRAMENVMNSLHGSIYHPPDWWEKWIDGQFQTSYSFEIASFGGEIRFFVRCEKSYRNAVESSIYSQYPDAEIEIVDDYTKMIPQDIPNQDWDLWATDYTHLKPNPYPILTYRKFEKEPETVEERKVEPMAALFEALSKIKPGEQFWIQITAKPVTNAQVPWVDESEAERDKLARRDPATQIKTKPMALEAAEILLKGMPEEKEKKETLIPPEMRLTPGERTTIEAVEEKAGKFGFLTNIRFIYLGKRDVFFKPNFRLGFTYFSSFMTQDLNALIPFGQTITKIKKGKFVPINYLIPRRLYLRQRKLFRNYVSRVNAFYPLSGENFILNTEELATLFHFPSWRAAPVPGITRVEAKKKAPPTLPTE
ncbi:MAG: hypothetical protein KJI71_05565 [Patescibacteria group bacterium]|nr:hypothetical protein [Patescibacteria group bacterium]